MSRIYNDFAYLKREWLQPGILKELTGHPEVLR
jgi:hypothetical protein